MSAPQSPGIRGWGRHGRHFTDWRRERSWLGRHTLLAALAGLALPIIIAALAGAFDATPPQAALAPAEDAALPESYAEWGVLNDMPLRDADLN